LASSLPDRPDGAWDAFLVAELGSDVEPRERARDFAGAGDELGAGRRGDGKQLDPSGRRRNVVSRWLRRVSSPSGSNDDDDDPPPAPAGLGIPFRPTFVAAHGRAAKKAPGLLGAAGRMMEGEGFYSFALVL
jgi:hypothetical protein